MLDGGGRNWKQKTNYKWILCTYSTYFSFIRSVLGSAKPRLQQGSRNGNKPRIAVNTMWPAIFVGFIFMNAPAHKNRICSNNWAKNKRSATIMPPLTVYFVRMAFVFRSFYLMFVCGPCRMCVCVFRFSLLKS